MSALPSPPIVAKVVLVDEGKRVERTLEGFETWEAAVARAERYVAHPSACGRWQHVYHTTWWDVAGRRKLCVRPVDAEPVS
jgi:hypothetical protein